MTQILLSKTLPWRENRDFHVTKCSEKMDFSTEKEVSISYEEMKILNE